MTAIRLGMSNDRAIIVIDGYAIDIEHRSHKQFSTDPMDLYKDWDNFCDWARQQQLTGSEPVINTTDLQCPVPRPSAVYGIGLNYKDHAEEAGLAEPKQPMVFTKFPSCLAGPTADIPLTSNRVDWEVELVVIIGKGGNDIADSDAMTHVAGYSIGQDISDRKQQFADPVPQFNLAKSATNYGPIGPVVVTTDAFEDPNDVPLSCDIDGETMQSSSTANLIFSISEVISFLSKWTTLMPGDVIFTGTPAGVGSVRNPRRYLVEGSVITTTIPHIGTMTNKCIAK